MRRCRTGFDACGIEQFPVLLRLVGEDAIDSRIADAVGDLLRLKKERQWDNRFAGMQSGQVKNCP